jgi:hypothetical protein
MGTLPPTPGFAGRGFVSPGLTGTGLSGKGLSGNGQSCSIGFCATSYGPPSGLKASGLTRAMTEHGDVFLTCAFPSSEYVSLNPVSIGYTPSCANSCLPELSRRVATEISARAASLGPRSPISHRKLASIGSMPLGSSPVMRASPCDLPESVARKAGPKLPCTLAPCIGMSFGFLTVRMIFHSNRLPRGATKSLGSLSMISLDTGTKSAVSSALVTSKATSALAVICTADEPAFPDPDTGFAPCIVA